MKRSPPHDDNWGPSLPPEDRERYIKAWQEFRSCRDCENWDCDEGDTVGACFQKKYHRVPVLLMTPEDYTCYDFEPKRKKPLDT